MRTRLSECPFALLGVVEGADAQELKAAYHLAAQRNHPDHGGTATDFIAIQRAWEVVSDPRSSTRHSVDGSCTCKAKIGGLRPVSEAPHSRTTTPVAESQGRVILSARDLMLLLAGALISLVAGYSLLALPCLVVAALVFVLLARNEATGPRATGAKVAAALALIPILTIVVMAVLVVLAVLAILAIVVCMFAAVS